MPYTEDFAEGFAPIDKAFFSAVTTVQDTGFVDASLYNRITVLIYATTVGTTLDVDIEVSESADGSNPFTLKSITQLVAADDGALVCIDIKGDEIANPPSAPGGNYRYLNVELTPDGAGTAFVLVLGHEARYHPVDQTLWAEAVS